MKFLLLTSLLLGTAARADEAPKHTAERLLERVAAVGILAVAQDSGLTPRERSYLRLIASVEGNAAALKVLGPEPRHPAASRFAIRPGKVFARRTVPQAAPTDAAVDAK